jgi:hypothetical protein
MKAVLCVLTLAAGASVAGPLSASARVGVFAIIDDISFEPSEFRPGRIWITGVFAVPEPMSSGLHRAPERGHLYFSVNPDAPDAARRDWAALKQAAGTGNVVGFGQYWVPHEDSQGRIVNQSLEVQIQEYRSVAVPDPYPVPKTEGVVTAFDTQSDLCPRFGRPSPEIAAALRTAHGDNVDADALPVCADRIGLVASSDLDSAFAAQAREPDWADAAEAAFSARIADVPGLELSDFAVQCRETVCRLHFVFPTEAYRHSAGYGLLGDALQDAPGFVDGGKLVEAHDGTAAADFYVQRRRVTASPSAR